VRSVSVYSSSFPHELVLTPRTLRCRVARAPHAVLQVRSVARPSRLALLDTLLLRPAASSSSTPQTSRACAKASTRRSLRVRPALLVLSLLLSTTAS